ncbi:MAG: Uncharacterized protein XD84_0266 [Desulfotomaculum sp. 46_80]|nr:MAG: Uncharacterized protein XD84_0266 [Desulfotomaculum sp. 46_80]
MKHSKWRIGAVLLAVVIVMGIISGIAFADTYSGKASNPPDKSYITAMCQSFISKFAGNLGVTEDEVRQALKDTQLQMIEDAVADGTITQNQADKMTEKIESGEGCGFIRLGFGHGPGGHGPCRDGKGPGPAPGNRSNSNSNK